MPWRMAAALALAALAVALIALPAPWYLAAFAAIGGTFALLVSESDREREGS